VQGNFLALLNSGKVRRMDKRVLDKIRVVLVETSHPGNIGAVARAMKTMCFHRLYLVRPNRFPCAEATARAAGSDDVLYHATVCETLEEALTGCSWVVGSSARRRHIAWPELSPKAFANAAVSKAQRMEVALVFGREQSGLTNSEVDHCHAIVHVPTNPEFQSLNIAAAVQILAYETQLAFLPANARATRPGPDANEVTVDDMERLYDHFEEALIEIDYLDPSKPKHLMRRLRRIVNRAQIDRSELNILRGILVAAQKAARRS